MSRDFVKYDIRLVRGLLARAPLKLPALDYRALWKWSASSRQLQDIKIRHSAAVQ